MITGHFPTPQRLSISRRNRVESPLLLSDTCVDIYAPRFHSLLSLSILINETPSRNCIEAELWLENATPTNNDNNKILSTLFTKFLVSFITLILFRTQVELLESHSLRQMRWPSDDFLGINSWCRRNTAFTFASINFQLVLDKSGEVSQGFQCLRKL